MKNQKNGKNSIVIKLIMLLLFVSGILVISYPFISNTVNNLYDQSVITNYQKEYSKLTAKEKNERLAELESENKKTDKRKCFNEHSRNGRC
ncbi:MULTISPECIES: hypothetical protein [unclassified Lactococcus]|uniref:hypothetical protein n=1 Tax=unclassified Lactococcus TaxID=2643510 RepID=UPI001E4F5747|nr:MULTISPECIES: hypothetical protein [unclassified Lactococcus]